MGKCCHCSLTSISRKILTFWMVVVVAGGITKFGHPFLGRYKKWDKVGHGMVRGSKLAAKTGTSFMDVP